MGVPGFVGHCLLGYLRLGLRPVLGAQWAARGRRIPALPGDHTVPVMALAAVWHGVAV